mmetsp:Transcript_4355/g.6531  ORF Transcript_4355/g.6531 Transcript_4355/m.6531 type:complete len:271 (-) Transcript_4355:755-1567(-)
MPNKYNMQVLFLSSMKLCYVVIHLVVQHTPLQQQINNAPPILILFLTSIEVFLPLPRILKVLHVNVRPLWNVGKFYRHLCVLLVYCPNVVMPIVLLIMDSNINWLKIVKVFFNVNIMHMYVVWSNKIVNAVHLVPIENNGSNILWKVSQVNTIYGPPFTMLYVVVNMKLHCVLSHAKKMPIAPMHSELHCESMLTMHLVIIVSQMPHGRISLLSRNNMNNKPMPFKKHLLPPPIHIEQRYTTSLENVKWTTKVYAKFSRRLKTFSGTIYL